MKVNVCSLKHEKVDEAMTLPYSKTDSGSSKDLTSCLVLRVQRLYGSCQKHGPKVV